MLPEPLQQVERTYVKWRGRKLTYFAGCDYFRMSSHPAVLKAMEQGMRKFGLNVGASRKTTGNHQLYCDLETALEQFFAVEKAVLTSNGYLTNLVLLQGIRGRIDLVLLDEKAHGSLLDAADLTGLPIARFKTLDVTDLQIQIQRAKKKRLLVGTDGVFSHNGQIAPLKNYLQILPGNSFLLVDDSHGAGVLGHRGRGTPEYFGISDARIIQTVTLSKAFGVYGGAILSTLELAEEVMAKSRIFVGNTPMPLPLANAALKAIFLAKKDVYRKKIAKNQARFKTRYLLKADWTGDTPVFGIAPENSEQAEAIRKSLLKHSVFPSFIVYPSRGSEGYFRFALSSEHSFPQIDSLGKALVEAGAIKTL